MPAIHTFHYAHQPDCRWNSGANADRGFAIFMASIGALQLSASGFRRRLTWAVGFLTRRMQIIKKT